MRTRQVQNMRVRGARCEVRASTDNSENRECIRLRYATREYHIIALYFNQPRDTCSCILQHFLRFSSFFVRRRRIPAHPGSVIQICSLITPKHRLILHILTSKITAVIMWHSLGCRSYGRITRRESTPTMSSQLKRPNAQQSELVRLLFLCG